MKLQEALDLLQDPEKLCIRAAELDGEQTTFWRYSMPYHDDQVIWKGNFATEEQANKDRATNLRWRPELVTPVEPYTNLRDVPNYPTDANALHEAEKRLGLHDRSNNALRVKWVNCLHDLMGKQPGCPVNKAGSPTVSDIDVLLAPTPVRCAAYVMVAEWKKVNQPEKL